MASEKTDMRPITVQIVKEPGANAQGNTDDPLVVDANLLAGSEQIGVVGVSDTTDTRIDPSTKQGLTAIETNQTDKTQFVKITDGTNDMTVNTEGRADIVQHSHIDQGVIHMHVDGLTAVSTTRYILIDISDTTNYPHTNTDYIHVEWVELEVDGSTAPASEYQVNLGFLENVDATDGDRWVVKHWSGTRSAGTSIREFFDPYPNGPRMRSESIATHMVNLNDVNYQTDVNLPTTLDPLTADTPSGNGDVIMEVIVTVGTINLAIEIGYHAHS